MKQKEFDAMLLGVGAVARLEIAKALIPLNEKVAALQAENAALKEAVKSLRQAQALADIDPDRIRSRYDSLRPQ